jgi:omega-6 fatty acid desaturase (delta-12 desaturase)
METTTGDASAVTALPGRRELIAQLKRYARPDTPRACMHFFVDTAIYIGGFAVVLAASSYWLKLLGGVVIAAGMGRLFSFAHNAAHENLTRSRSLNRVLAFLAFTPIYYNYRLWCYEHHFLHHPYCNDTKPDAYRPFSKMEFDALPAWRQWLERLYRGPFVIGWSIYYLKERHWQTKIWVPSYVPQKFRAAAWLNTAWVLAYAAALVAFLMYAPAIATNLSVASSLVFGFVIPLLVFDGADAFTLYVQHTDPRIPWFKEEKIDRQGAGRTELVSVHLDVPRWFGWYAHETYSHPVHHLLPAIPFFNAYEAQKELNWLLGPAAVVRKATLAWLLDTTRRCQLYDWEKKQWLGFDGKPTYPAHEWPR